MLLDLSKEQIKKLDRGFLKISIGFMVLITLVNIFFLNSSIKPFLLAGIAIIEGIFCLLYLPQRQKRAIYDIEQEEAEKLEAMKKLEEEHLEKLTSNLINEIKFANVDDCETFLPLVNKLLDANIEKVFIYLQNKLLYMGYELDNNNEDISQFATYLNMPQELEEFIDEIGLDELYLNFLSFLCSFRYQEYGMLDLTKELSNKILELKKTSK